MLARLEDLARDYWTPDQLRWIRDDSPLKLCEKSRRIGWTYATSFRRVLKAMRTPGLDCWVGTRDLTSAKEFLRYCLRWVKLAETVCKIIAPDLDDPDLAEDTVFCIVFPNNARIYVLSSNPDAFASKGGDIVLDEFALHKDQNLLWQVAQPTAAVWGYQIEVISTHRGRGTLFNRFCQDARDHNKMRWSHYKLDIVSALRNGLMQRLNAVRSRRGLPAETIESMCARLRRECATDEQWRQEYMCEPTDDLGALLSYELIDRQSRPGAEILLDAPLEPRPDIRLGMDIGRVKDRSVICVIQNTGAGIWTTRALVIMRNCPWHEQFETLENTWQIWHPRAGRIDSTGIGSMLAEEAARKIDARILGIDFTLQSKDRMASGMLRAFQDAAILIPDDADLRDDLHRIEMVVSDARNIRYVASSGEEGHADRFWSLALALDSRDAIGLTDCYLPSSTGLEAAQELFVPRLPMSVAQAHARDQSPAGDEPWKEY